MVVSPYIRATSHTRQESPWSLHFKQVCSLVEKADLVQVYFTLHLRSNGVCECKMDGCKVYMDFYMASNGSCFLVTSISSKKPPLRHSPNTKPRDHGTPNLHNNDLFYFIMSEDPCEHKFIKKKAFG